MQCTANKETTVQNDTTAALEQMLTGRPSRQQATTAIPAQPARRIRNYKAMKPAKLVRVYEELLTGGEAYDRCLESGSGDPDRDIDVVRCLVSELS